MSIGCHSRLDVPNDRDDMGAEAWMCIDMLTFKKIGCNVVKYVRFGGYRESRLYSGASANFSCGPRDGISKTFTVEK